MKKTTRTILAGALCAAMAATLSPTAELADAATANDGVSVQVGIADIDSGDEWDDEDEESESFSEYVFYKSYYEGSIPSRIEFARGYDEGGSGKPYVYEGKDYIVGKQWFKCIANDDDTSYVRVEGTPSTAGVYVLRIAGIGDYAGAKSYAVLRIEDPYDIGNCYISSSWDQDKEGYFVVGEKSTHVSRLSVTFYDDRADKTVCLKEGVDYKQIGWCKVNDVSGADVDPEFVGNNIVESGVYRCRVEGIGKYHGTLDSSDCAVWATPNEFSLFAFDAKSPLQLGKDNLNNIKVSASRKTVKGKKVVLRQGKDFYISNWHGLNVYDDSWQTDPDKVIDTPTKTGCYGIAIKGLGAYKGQEAEVEITVFKPKMTYNLPALYARNFADNTKLKSLVLGNKVKEIDRSALEGCKNLTKLVIGKNVDTINFDAFKGCKNLKTITVKGSKIGEGYVSKYAFEGSSVITIKVDTGNKKTDKQAIRAYKRIFTKEKCGKRLVVK